MTYGQPTPAVLEVNNHIFRSPTSAANAPEVLFRRIKECAEKALLGQDLYTDKQLITNTIRLLLTTGLYVRAFEDWDQLLEPNKTWIELRWMIQDAFQRWLNATAPIAGHQGYAPALPFQQSALGALAGKDLDDDSADTVAMQMAALTYQSQLTATTAANLFQQMDQYVQTLAHQQEQLQKNQHQIMEQMAAFLFNQSNMGQGIGCQRRSPPPPGAPFAPIQFGGNNLEDEGDEDVDVDAGADVAKARPHLLHAVHPLSCPLWRGGYRRLQEHTQRWAEGVIHPHTRQTPKCNPILTSQRSMQTGTLNTPVGLMWPTATPVRCAPTTKRGQITTNTSHNKMPSNTLMLGITAARSFATRWFTRRCDG